MFTMYTPMLPASVTVPSFTPVKELAPPMTEEKDEDIFGDGPMMGTGTAFDTSEEPPVYTPPS